MIQQRTDRIDSEDTLRRYAENLLAGDKIRPGKKTARRERRAVFLEASAGL